VPIFGGHPIQRADLLSGGVFDFEVFESYSDLFVVGGNEVVDARRVVGVVARVSRRVESSVHAGATAIDEVAAVTVARHRRCAGNRVICIQTSSTNRLKPKLKLNKALDENSPFSCGASSAIWDHTLCCLPHDTSERAPI